MPSNLNAHMRQIGHYLPETFLFPCHTHTLFGIDENLLPSAPKSQLYNWWPWNVELSTLLRYWYLKAHFLTLIEKVQFHQYLQSGKLLLLRKSGNNLKKSLRHQKLFKHDITVNHICINWSCHLKLDAFKNKFNIKCNLGFPHLALTFEWLRWWTFDWMCIKFCSSTKCAFHEGESFPLLPSVRYLWTLENWYACS